MSNKQRVEAVSHVIAEFADPGSLLKAAERIRDAGYKKFDTYSPFPVHGIEEAMGLKPTPLGWIVLCGGFLGLTGGFGLQTWVSTTAYPLTISGKPLFSFQAFVPITFELMVLFSAFFAIFGLLGLSKLPMFYHAVFKHSRMSTASSHGFLVSIESHDPLFDEEKVTSFLKEIGGSHVEVIRD